MNDGKQIEVTPCKPTEDIPTAGSFPQALANDNIYLEKDEFIPSFEMNSMTENVLAKYYL